MLRLSLADGPGLARLAHFKRVIAVSLYGDSLVRTFGIAAAVAAICAFFGYPTALLIHRAKGAWKLALTAAVVLPYFISVLIRTYSWMVLLGRNGPINKLLLGIGLIDAPLPLIFNRASVLISISAVLLPLMVLTVLGSLSRVDPLLHRAAVASGAAPLAAFWRVLFPQTLPGLLAGVLLVFISVLGFFITPSLLGGPADQMFAMHITQQADFLASGGFLQALAALLLAVTLVVIAVAGRLLGLEFIWGGVRRRRQSVMSVAALVTAAEPEVQMDHDSRGAHLPQTAHASRRDTTLGRSGSLPSTRGPSTLLADIVGWPLLRLLDRMPAWLGTLASTGIAAIALASLLLPILVAAFISFSNAVYMTFPPPSYSLRWYDKFFSDSVWMSSLATSVGIGLLSAAVSVVVGTAAALALVRSNLPAKSLWMAFFVSPLIVPGVVLGLSLYSLFLRFDLLGTAWGLAAAHSTGGIALVLVIVAASLQAVDRRQEQAAAVHGASPWRVFWLVTLPAIRPSVAAAGFFAFLHSFDDLVFSMFLSGTHLSTLPLRLWANVNYKLDPLPAVVATFEVAAIVLALLVYQIRYHHRGNE
ncbi:MAG: Binding-protein-dependent transport system inner rane component [Rhizobacter sp.]|nr:Binding-protein-dependent transport system inner rane component [Rhizobacter sp.]